MNKVHELSSSGQPWAIYVTKGYTDRGIENGENEGRKQEEEHTNKNLKGGSVIIISMALQDPSSPVR